MIIRPAPETPSFDVRRATRNAQRDARAPKPNRDVRGADLCRSRPDRRDALGALSMPNMIGEV